MIPYQKIKKQLWSDPEIVDHFILSKQHIIEDIRDRVIIINQENDIQIKEEEAEGIAEKYFEKNKNEIISEINKFFDYMSDSDYYLQGIELNKDDLLRKL